MIHLSLLTLALKLRIHSPTSIFRLTDAAAPNST